MKKMKKLFFSVFALSALMFSACSGSSDEQPSNPDGDATSQEPASQSSDAGANTSTSASGGTSAGGSSSSSSSSPSGGTSSSIPVPDEKADYRVKIGTATYDLVLDTIHTDQDVQYFFGDQVTKAVTQGDIIVFEQLRNDEYTTLSVQKDKDDIGHLTYNNVMVDGNNYVIRATDSVQVYLKQNNSTEQWSFFITGGDAMPATYIGVAPQGVWDDIQYIGFDLDFQGYLIAQNLSLKAGDLFYIKAFAGETTDDDIYKNYTNLSYPNAKFEDEDPDGENSNHNFKVKTAGAYNVIVRATEDGEVSLMDYVADMLFVSLQEGNHIETEPVLASLMTDEIKYVIYDVELKASMSLSMYFKEGQLIEPTVTAGQAYINGSNGVYHVDADELTHYAFAFTLEDDGGLSVEVVKGDAVVFNTVNLALGSFVGSGELAYAWVWNHNVPGYSNRWVKVENNQLTVEDDYDRFVICSLSAAPADLYAWNEDSHVLKQSDGDFEIDNGGTLTYITSDGNRGLFTYGDLPAADGFSVVVNGNRISAASSSGENEVKATILGIRENDVIKILERKTEDEVTSYYYYSKGIEENVEGFAFAENRLTATASGNYDFYIKHINTDDKIFWIGGSHNVTAEVNGSPIVLSNIKDSNDNDNIAVYLVSLAKDEVISFRDYGENIHYLDGKGETSYQASVAGDYYFYYSKNGLMYISAPVSFSVTSTTVESGFSVYVVGENYGNWGPQAANKLTLSDGKYVGTLALPGGEGQQYKLVKVKDDDPTTIIWETYNDSEHNNNRIVNASNNPQPLELTATFAAYVAPVSVSFSANVSKPEGWENVENFSLYIWNASSTPLGAWNDCLGNLTVTSHVATINANLAPGEWNAILYFKQGEVTKQSNDLEFTVTAAGSFTITLGEMTSWSGNTFNGATIAAA